MAGHPMVTAEATYDPFTTATTAPLAAVTHSMHNPYAHDATTLAGAAAFLGGAATFQPPVSLNNVS